MIGSPSSSRLLVNGILGQTSQLVRYALGGNWSGVVAAAERRRELLRRLENHCFSQDETVVTALRQAVAESDRALATMGSASMVSRTGFVLR